MFAFYIPLTFPEKHKNIAFQENCDIIVKEEMQSNMRKILKISVAMNARV